MRYLMSVASDEFDVIFVDLYQFLVFSLGDNFGPFEHDEMIGIFHHFFVVCDDDDRMILFEIF